MFKTDKRLYRLAMQYNKAYFDNSLPQDLIVGWEDELENTRHYGATISLEDDQTRQVTFRVGINSSLKKNYEGSRFTLLHELVHVKLYPYLWHGKKFNHAMIGLAVKGAFNDLW